MKLCIVSYYELRESLKCAADSLSLFGYDISYFPYYAYMNKPNFVEIFIEKIKKENIKYVLWWVMNIELPLFIQIKNETNVTYLYFNWDEPYNWTICDVVNKMKYIDAAFVTCQETLDTYIKNGTKNAICLYPGFSDKIHYINNNYDHNIFQKYSCDISICCTNLYDDDNLYPNQYIKRKELIDAIYNAQDKYGFTFNIYGSGPMKNLYPKSYKGFINYHDTVHVFNYSKINLCTHVLCNKGEYINERVILVGACGGLLLVDHVKDIDKVFKVNEEILILDKENYIQQIVNILNNYDDYLFIRENLYKKCINNYTYDNWATTIYNCLSQMKN